MAEGHAVHGMARRLARLAGDDGDPATFLAKVTRSRRPIGELVLDQSIIAGIGNVYRAELLHRARLSPDHPGRDLNPTVVERLWIDAVDLMSVGLGAGWIVTNEAQLTAARDLLIRGARVPRWPKRYAVYARAGRSCTTCRTTIRARLMGRQRISWCPTCQPAPGDPLAS